MQPTPTHTTSRRTLLKTGLAAAAAQSLPFAASAQTPATAAEPRFQPQVGPWRTFEVTTTVQVADVKGATQIWLPLPDINTDYQQSLDHSWTGNATSVHIAADPKQGVRLLHAEFDVTEKAPTLALTSRVRTRNRALDWANTTGKPAKAPSEDPAVLRFNLQPTEWQPLDGIVRSTALKITQNGRNRTDVDKVRAIYNWVVDNSYREPKVRGCGTGDIKTMLETGNLGGKCADLNALFVGLCRAVGVPARDVYGLRLVPSEFGYRELSGNPANLKGAQHCRAEVWLHDHGWVAMDPADVLKVMRQEKPDQWIKDVKHPLIAPVNKALFGSWEGNWVGWNTAHDITLPGSGAKATLPFLMYPQGQNESGRFDELAPDGFRYGIVARELKG
jgi:transglutaminase-like putative cysteine protease